MLLSSLNIPRSVSSYHTYTYTDLGLHILDSYYLEFFKLQFIAELLSELYRTCLKHKIVSLHKLDFFFYYFSFFFLEVFDQLKERKKTRVNINFVILKTETQNYLVAQTVVHENVFTWITSYATLTKVSRGDVRVYFTHAVDLYIQ